MRRATDVDHVDQARHDDHSDVNLTSLCASHHAAKSSSEGNAAWSAMRARGRHSTERHPGEHGPR